MFVRNSRRRSRGSGRASSDLEVYFCVRRSLRRVAAGDRMEQRGAKRRCNQAKNMVQIYSRWFSIETNQEKNGGQVRCATTPWCRVPFGTYRRKHALGRRGKGGRGEGTKKLENVPGLRKQLRAHTNTRGGTNTAMKAFAAPPSTNHSPAPTR